MNQPIGSGVSYGIACDIKFVSGARIVLRNVTEIHYNYNRKEPAMVALMGPQIAFESDIHQSGNTFRVSDIAEFETFGETEKQPDFS